LSDSAAHIENVAGDARLELARERDHGIRQDFDILVIDAFSSDGVPVHLLTLEALDRYAQALAPGGLIALHVSTNHLDLIAQVVRQGKAAGFGVLAVSSEKQPKFFSQRTDWVLLAPDREDMEPIADRLRRARAKVGIPPAMLVTRSAGSGLGDDLRVWTDEQSDIFSLLRGLH
jgi:spermidine synthase